MSEATANARGPGITFFRETAGAAGDDGKMMENRSSSVAMEGMMGMMDAGLSDGYVLKCLYRSSEPDGMSLLYAWFKGNYALPPHSHDTDCLYYIVAGSIQLGSSELTAGDGFFVPKDALYSYNAGPEGVEILEFRGASQFDIVLRDGSPRAWERMAAMVTTNRDLWKSQRPPVRVPKV
jgi:mannose-6-phosphate isomerase-like protein (cupin superfamily)